MNLFYRLLSLFSPVVDFNECINSIHNETNIDKEIISKVLDSEDNFLRKKGIIRE